MKKLCFVLLMGMVGLAQAVDVLKVHKGDVISDSVSFGDRSYALPKGTWAVMMAIQWKGQINNPNIGSTEYFPMAGIFLAQWNAKQQRLVHLLVMRGSTGEVGAIHSSWKEDPCHVPSGSYYQRDTFSSSYQYPECLLIRPEVQFLTSNDGVTTDLRQWVSDHHIRLPYTMLKASYSKLTQHRTFQAELYTNPLFYRYPFDGEAIATLNSWYPTNADAVRKAFIDSFSEYTRAYALEWQADFDGKQPQVQPVALRFNPTPRQQASDSSATLATQH